MKARILCIVAASMLAGCSSYSFHTNLSPDNVAEYFTPSAVDVMDKDELLKYNSKALGSVSGLSCQADERDFIANEADARTDARIKAARMGANAIVFNKCVVVTDSPSCLKSVTCYGQAYIRGDKIR